MRLAEALYGDATLRGEAFNFWNEIQVDVLDSMRRILTRMESTLVPDVRNEAMHEIKHQWLSAAKAPRVLDWVPAFTLDVGIDRTIAWYRKHFADV